MINYNYYETKTHRSLILKPLQDYNVVFTGVRPEEDRYFYVIEENKLIGSIYANLSWDWVTLDNIYYINIDVLQLLLSKVCFYFKDKASGILYDGYDLDIIDDFLKIGFNHEGKIDKTSKLSEHYFISNMRFDIVSNLELNVVETSKIDEALDKDLKECKNNKEENSKTDLIIIAKDNEKFIGGVHAEITNDSMYVSLLVVLDEYKGKKIGTKLMDLLEEKAILRGVVSIDLGTCDFQAKPFYEKRGYKVIATLHDYPKGFNEYTLVKRLD